MYTFLFDKKSMTLFVGGLALAGLLFFGAGVLVGLRVNLPTATEQVSDFKPLAGSSSSLVPSAEASPSGSPQAGQTPAGDAGPSAPSGSPAPSAETPAPSAPSTSSPPSSSTPPSPTPPSSPPPSSPLAHSAPSAPPVSPVAESGLETAEPAVAEVMSGPWRPRSEPSSSEVANRSSVLIAQRIDEESEEVAGLETRLMPVSTLVDPSSRERSSGEPTHLPVEDVSSTERVAEAPRGAPQEAPHETPRFTVQVGAYGNEEYVEERLAALRREGFDAWAEPILTGSGQELQAVRFGNFDSKAAAQASAERYLSGAPGREAIVRPPA